MGFLKFAGSLANETVRRWDTGKIFAGALVYRTIGVKVADFRNIPAEVFTATEAAFPDCLQEKTAWPAGQYPWADFVGGSFFQD